MLAPRKIIRKFLKMPIEDVYLEDESEGTKVHYGMPALPFDQADNPVKSVVASLARAVSVGVAAEEAKITLHELTDGKEEPT